MNMAQFFTKEKTASIRQIQQNPSKALQGITRVMKGSKTMGFFLDKEAIEDFIEDVEASLSEEFKREVAEARADYKAGRTKGWLTAAEVAKQYGV